MQKARGQASTGHPAYRPPTACRPTVSGSLSLPSPGFFSPFPHGTGPLSVAEECLALEGGPPSFPRGCTCPVVLGYVHQQARCDFVYGTLTLSGGPSQDLRLSRKLVTRRVAPVNAPQPHGRSLGPGLGSSPFARRYSGHRACFLVLEVLRCFSSLGSRLTTYRFSGGRAGITPPRFPHSDIPGSRPACGSPRLFAACHVLPRFSAPRHPPSALSSLTTTRSSLAVLRSLLAWLLSSCSLFGCQRTRHRPAMTQSSTSNKCYWLDRKGESSLERR
jgi:hypothetical protein